MTDEMIIRKIHNKDPEGLKNLMDRYIPYVSAVVWNILRYAMTAEDAEEVVSDVFLVAWEQPEDLRAGQLKPWLGAVARNKAKNKLRQMGRDLPLEENILEAPGDDPLEREEERRLVRQAVASLEPQDREIFLRHYYGLQSVKAVAKAMEMNESTVKSRLRRGRNRLKEYLTGGNCYET